MTVVAWPDPDAVIDVLSEIMRDQGHTLHLRDRGALEAAFARPRQYADYAPDCGLCELAALTFDAIATRHPLVDGNKRLAWLTAATFLDLNGCYLDARDIEVFEIGMALIEKRVSIQDMAAFLDRNLLKDA